MKRVAAAPNIPTIAESGMRGFDFSSWYGLWGPKGLPADITAKLQAEIVKALAQPDIRERLATLGFEAIGSTPAEFATFIEAEFRALRTNHPRREDQGGVAPAVVMAAYSRPCAETPRSGPEGSPRGSNPRR